MTGFFEHHEVRAVIDPDHTEGLIYGGRMQLVTVIMDSPPPVDEHSPPRRPAGLVMLRADEARALAGELLELADRAQAVTAA